jgi:hypothetical protein
LPGAKDEGRVGKQLERGGVFDARRFVTYTSKQNFGNVRKAAFRNVTTNVEKAFANVRKAYWPLHTPVH